MDMLAGKCNRGSKEEVEREKLYLEAQKKQNRLLDLEIEAKELELEIRRDSVRR